MWTSETQEVGFYWNQSVPNEMWYWDGWFWQYWIPVQGAGDGAEHIVRGRIAWNDVQAGYLSPVVPGSPLDEWGLELERAIDV